jgi:hypothetical protein
MQLQIICLFCQAVPKKGSHSPQITTSCLPLKNGYLHTYAKYFKTSLVLQIMTTLQNSISANQ